MVLPERLHVLAQTLNEGADGHHAQINTATGTHGYRLGITLFVADHKEVRHLFQRVLPYFIANLLVAQIRLYSNPLFLQRLG